MPVVLSPVEIAIETYGRPLFSRELEEMFFSPHLTQRFFEDERALGNSLLSLKEYWEQLPEKYKKAIEIREKIENLPEEKASELIFSLVEKIGNGSPYTAGEEEKIAVYKAFRTPKIFLKELNSLFLISLKIGEDVLEKVGIKEKMSIATSYFTYNNIEEDLSPTDMVSLLFFTNLEWYDPSFSYPLFFSMTRYFNKKDRYPDEILSDEGELFWGKIEKFIKSVKDDAEIVVSGFSIGLNNPTPFDVYSLARGGVVVAEIPYVGKSYLPDLLKKMSKRKWGKAYALVEKAVKIVKNKKQPLSP